MAKLWTQSGKLVYCPGTSKLAYQDTCPCVSERCNGEACQSSYTVTISGFVTAPWCTYWNKTWTLNWTSECQWRDDTNSVALTISGGHWYLGLFPCATLVDLGAVADIGNCPPSPASGSGTGCYSDFFCSGEAFNYAIG